MTTFDQIEIISAGGVIEFYDLNPAQGLTNIGSHPENDVVLPGGSVAPFHLVIDHRAQPVQLLVLAEEQPTTLDGRALNKDQPWVLQNWSSIEIGGYTLILMQNRNGSQAAAGVQTGANAGGFPSVTPTVSSAGAAFETTVPRSAPRAPASSFGGQTVGATPPPAAGVSFPPAVIVPLSGNGGGQVAAAPANSGDWGDPQRLHRLLSPVLDHIDELIQVGLGERDQLVDVDQTVAYQLTITNAGDLVASFDLSVEGVDPNWLVVLPARVDLNDGQSGIVTVTVTPPRYATTTSGRYYLSFTVTTPEYPGHYSQVGASLTVRPYFNVQIGELSHKRQTLKWNRPIGETYFTVANSGNSMVQVQLEAQDEERACRFEFQFAEQGLTFTRQAELNLGAGGQSEVALLIEPNDRPLISFRNRTYQYDVRATPLGGQQFPRMIAGQVKVIPLIGKGLILLFLFLILALVIVIFSPGVDQFYLTDSQASPVAEVHYGTPVVLNWRASRFSAVSLQGPGLALATPRPLGTAELLPVESETYNIEAQNFISRLGLPSLFGKRVDTTTIRVIPVDPIISLSADKETLTVGEAVRFDWSIQQADRALLVINNNPTALPTEQFVGSVSMTPSSDLVVQIIASNPSVANSGTPHALSKPIQVVTPPPTPLPPPAVLVFSAAPIAITAGETVNLEWRVRDAATVSIENLGDNLPAEGSRQVTPLQTTTFVLRANTSSPGVSGGGQIFEEVTVIVVPPPTATATPKAPTITFFQASPKEVVRDGTEPVKLSWSVGGDVTSVIIFSPDLQIPSTLTRTGTIPIQPNKSTFFILTAANGPQSTTAQVDITVLEPSPTPLPTETATATTTATPTPTLTPTATATPKPEVAFFNAESGESPSSPDDVQLIGADTYRVLVGSLVRLTWSSNLSTRVQLRAVKLDNSTVDYGTRPLGGDFTFRFDGSIRSFELTAHNDFPEGGTVASQPKVITIDALEIRPPAPFAMNGLSTEAQNQVSWSYDSQSLSLIRSFRIYRANGDGQNATLVAEVAPTETTWTDTIQPTCGRSYFVVATYLNVEGQILETESPETSWFSNVCPTN